VIGLVIQLLFFGSITALIQSQLGLS
jgi:hypothetical protein